MLDDGFSFLVLNQTCSSFKKNTPLHLACAALSLSTAQVLLKAGADQYLIDEQQRTPAGKIELVNIINAMISVRLDCIPMTNTVDQQRMVDTLKKLLREQSSEQQSSTLIDSIISSKKGLFGWKVDEFGIQMRTIKSLLNFKSANEFN